MLARSDDDRPAGGAFQQADAAQDQGAHDALAEICLLHHEVAQSLGGNDQRLDRLARLDVDKRGPGGKLREFAGKLARPVGDDRLRSAEPAALDGVELARKDQDQPGPDLACPDDGLARCVGAGLSKAT